MWVSLNHFLPFSIADHFPPFPLQLAGTASSSSSKTKSFIAIAVSVVILASIIAILCWVSIYRTCKAERYRVTRSDATEMKTQIAKMDTEQSTDPNKLITDQEQSEPNAADNPDNHYSVAGPTFEMTNSSRSGSLDRLVGKNSGSEDMYSTANFAQQAETNEPECHYSVAGSAAEQPTNSDENSGLCFQLLPPDDNKDQYSSGAAPLEQSLSAMVKSEFAKVEKAKGQDIYAVVKKVPKH